MGARSRCWPSFASSSVAWAVAARAARPALPSVRAGREAAAVPSITGRERGAGQRGRGGPPVAGGRTARRRVGGRPARAGGGARRWVGGGWGGGRVWGGREGGAGVGRRAVERLAPAPGGVAPARWASAA